MRTIFIRKHSQSKSKPICAEYCDSFWGKFKGLMFRPSISKGEGLVLVESSDSRLNTAIHMFFMKFSIAAVWINSEYQVVDVQLAKPWQPFLLPRQAARYVLETHPASLQLFKIGDQVDFIDG